MCGAYRFERLRTALGQAIGFDICEPKLRLGRRRHDGLCDQCGKSPEAYAMETLEFPLADFDSDASTSTEKLRAMLDAQYVQVCLECSADIEANRNGGDS